MPDDIRDEAASARDIPLLHRRLRRRRLPHRDLAHHRVHPQAPPRDIHGHGLGGVVFGRYRGCSRRLRFVRRRWRMEAHARLRHRTLRLPADRQVQSPRVAPVAEKQGRHEEARRVVFRVYGADVILEDEEEEPKHKAGFAEVFSKGYAARIVFWGFSRYARSFPCTPSTRSVRRL